MALISAAIQHGYGLHLQDIEGAYDRQQALMYTYVAPTISVVASTFGKISMVHFVVRLLGQSVRKIHLWLLYSVTVIMIAANILTVGLLLGGCMPMEKSWRPDVSGKCIHPSVFDYIGRTQSGSFLAYQVDSIADSCVSLECLYGSYRSGVSCLYGVEIKPKAKY